VRFDIDPAARPDITGTLQDMSAVESGSVDALYSAHNIEHLYAHEVPVALREFRRVLKDDGFVVLTCPDLRSVCQAVLERDLLGPLYESTAGPIAAIDILYGHRPDLRDGHHYMAHRCGCTWPVLQSAAREAGFVDGLGGARASHFDLWLLAFKTPRSPDEVSAIARAVLP
jgi:SAM-dependent methyltransferase